MVSLTIDISNFLVKAYIMKKAIPTVAYNNDIFSPQAMTFKIYYKEQEENYLQKERLASDYGMSIYFLSGLACYN